MCTWPGYAWTCLVTPFISAISLPLFDPHRRLRHVSNESGGFATRRKVLGIVGLFRACCRRAGVSRLAPLPRACFIVFYCSRGTEVGDNRTDWTPRRGRGRGARLDVRSDERARRRPPPMATASAHARPASSGRRWYQPHAHATASGMDEVDGTRSLRKSLRSRQIFREESRLEERLGNVPRLHSNSPN